MSLACKLCLLKRTFANLPPDIENATRYESPADLLAHMNVCHQLGFDGSEENWPAIVEEAADIAAGFLIACGEPNDTYHSLWCLNCDYRTAGPFTFGEQECPHCGRTFGIRRSAAEVVQ